MTLKEKIIASKEAGEQRLAEINRALALLDDNDSAEELITLLTKLNLIPLFPELPNTPQ